jgi:hypothetical protein
LSERSNSGKAKDYHLVKHASDLAGVVPLAELLQLLARRMHEKVRVLDVLRVDRSTNTNMSSGKVAFRRAATVLCYLRCIVCNRYRS